MTLHIVNPGVQTTLTTKLNDNLAECYNMDLKNHIRTLIDRAGVYSKDSTDIWGEAYIDANGRNDSVDIGSTDAVFSVNKYTASGTKEITHTIPSGTFPATINSAIGTPLVEDWETGASINYKLTNATEDTGWLTSNVVSNFTAFTSQPTKLIVQLVPKISSPTAGYPSIRGFAVKV